jgi:hypothetical protein
LQVRRAAAAHAHSLLSPSSSPRTTRPPPPASSTLVVRLESPPIGQGPSHPDIRFLSLPSLPPLLPGRRRGKRRRAAHREGGQQGGGGTQSFLPLARGRSPQSLLLGLGSNSGCHNTTSAGGHRQPCRPSTSLAVLPRSVPSVWFGSVLGFHSCFRSGLC